MHKPPLSRGGGATQGGAEEGCFQPVLPCFAAQNIVYADLVQVGQTDQKIHGDRPGPLFVPPINLALAAQIVRNVLLRHIMVDPQILDFLEIHHITPLTMLPFGGMIYSKVLPFGSKYRKTEMYGKGGQYGKKTVVYGIGRVVCKRKRL